MAKRHIKYKGMGTEFHQDAPRMVLSAGTCLESGTPKRLFHYEHMNMFALPNDHSWELLLLGLY